MCLLRQANLFAAGAQTPVLCNNNPATDRCSQNAAANHFYPCCKCFDGHNLFWKKVWRDGLIQKNIPDEIIRDIKTKFLFLLDLKLFNGIDIRSTQMDHIHTC